MNVIIDYGMGNLKSLQNAMRKAGIETIITDDLKIIEEANLLILPGVGAFRDAIKAINEKGLSELIINHAEKGKFLVGICLGMQLLYEKSYEYGKYKGLGIIKGEIVKLAEGKKIPHMGWNNIRINQKDELVKYIKDDDFVYFVHSYYASSYQNEMIAYSEYGEIIPAIVRKGNVIGFQFHPEKSSEIGAKLLKALGEIVYENNSGN
jgi:glutamine amidotransferase